MSSLLDQLFAEPVYGLSQAEKEARLTPEFNRLSAHHAQNCAEYGRMLKILPGSLEATRLADVPFLPVGMFKSHALRSIPAERVFRTMTSSGTTGQQVSQIFLDEDTARRQTVALGRIFAEVLGPARLPMLIVDTPGLLKNRARFGARTAGVLGMMNFGRQHFFCLDDDMKLDEAGLRAFLDRHQGGPFLIFGFTFMVWSYLLEAIAGLGLDLSQGILVHSGGWKKLESQKVDNQEFRRRWIEHTGLKRIHNFYGMVEQVGSVYVEGDDGLLHAPNFADIIIRDPYTFAELPTGETGVIQVLSILPTSYPGHSILTEDLGVVESVDAGTWKGKAFRVIGRAPQVELRGCSDVHAAEAVAR
jgi:hypothetical protein